MSNDEWFSERYKVVKEATDRWPEWAQKANKKEYESKRNSSSNIVVTEETKKREKTTA